MRLFGGSDSKSAAAKSSARVSRVSSGWLALLKTLKENEGQRVLDIGPTSSNNINFLTSLGHSIYMADLASEAINPKWRSNDPDAPFPAEGFIQENLNFGARRFDTVLFWDAGDYLPPVLLNAVIARLHDSIVPHGELLAFFHVKPGTCLNRYHLRDDGRVDVQYISDQPTGELLNNRQIEKLFAAYNSYKFFLAKDNLREVVVTR